MSASLFPLAKRFEDLSADDLWHFIRNVMVERDSEALTPEEKTKLMDFRSGFGNIFTRHAYYQQVYCGPLHRALTEIHRRYPDGSRVLDVGCGVGTQSILFSLLPATVLGIDINRGQLSTAGKRREFYARYFKTGMDIEFRRVDMLATAFADLGRFDVVYSHESMGRFLKAEQVFEKVSAAMNRGGLLILKNENPQCLGLRLAKKPIDLDGEKAYREAAQRHGFRTVSIRGTTAIPRKFWFAGNLTRIPDALLRRLNLFRIHLEMTFEKAG